ncbi:DUF4230 domain-containing protein [Clostridium sp. JN-9]|uniref:DUF4230 domain-containing protein n=1 Tax=Clostridium sp. JN-9 TaxID=2507159 RepID=UPI000FFE23DE|nr:DUF4230 domain-containing protein [Clostridium sp. JN-9]QAT40882.1 DUF4230 domain-containing protein [Clostridium sp. JN-9]
MESKTSKIKKIKRFMPLLLILVIILLSIFTIISIKQKNAVTSSIVQEKLVKIKELATTKYSYTKVLELKNNKAIGGIDMPFTEKYFLLQYDGYIKAGVDLTKAKIDIKNKDTINITLEKSKILDHVIDESSIHLYDEKSSVFNKLQLQDIITEISKQKSAVEQDAIKKGLLTESDRSVKTLLTEFLQSLGFKNVNILLKD